MKKSRLARVVPACLLASACIFVTPAALSAPLYDITITGLTDAEHTRDDGYQFSANSYQLNATGQVLGRSLRFNGALSKGQSSWLYSNGSTTKIGLVDGAHTVSGYQSSQGVRLNDAGQVIGTSNRFITTSGGFISGFGQSAWFYDGAMTSNIGLIDAEHTRNDGYRSSYFNNFNNLNAAGQVVGISERYNGGTTNLGNSAWLYSGGATTRIGLLDAEHTGSGDKQNSGISMLNQAGQVLGSSLRYNGGTTSLGTTYWVYSGGVTTAIGLNSAAYTRNDGWRQTQTMLFDGLNEAGQVVGTSTRYDGTASVTGQSVWFYSAGATTDISLTDAEHTRNDGHRQSNIQTFSPNRKQFNQAGQVLGTSARYNGGATSLGQTAWLYNSNDASRITLGFTDAAHTSSTGARSSTGNILNEAGQVAGVSTRYNGGASYAGNTAWLYSAGVTTAIGLTDVEHTRNDGRQDSNIRQLNEAGQVVGSATRYNGGGTLLGESVWMYDGTDTTNIGLSGAVFTRDDGYQQDYFSSLNEAGQVIGESYRYNGGATQQGATAWFYDSTLDQTYSMDFSVRSDGYALSNFAFLSDAGFALGYYELFATDDSSLGKRAIYFSPDDGWLELGSLVDGGLSTAGWSYLADAIYANGADQIIGAGLLDGMTDGQMTYLLTAQVVPVPGAVWLFGSGLLCLLGIARRKKVTNDQ